MVLVTSHLAYGSGEASGTGMVLTADGLVVTNHHVVEGATRIEVAVAGSAQTYTARLVGTDSARDIAVLRLVGASGLTTITVDTARVSVGDTVTAVGDAGGDGGSLTAATGTVTGLRKSISTQEADGTSERLHRLIAVDADVVSGDSGGALLDEDGQVVGMTTAASSGSFDITGYAVPINRVLKVTDAIIAGTDRGSIEIGYDAYLGVQLYDSADSADGATVAAVVDGSAADQAGLQPGDTITEVDDTAIGDGQALSKAISGHHPGDNVTITWEGSDGDAGTAAVTLTRAPIQ